MTASFQIRIVAIASLAWMALCVGTVHAQSSASASEEIKEIDKQIETLDAQMNQHYREQTELQRDMNDPDLLMFPLLGGEDRIKLTRDDVVALSILSIHDENFVRDILDEWGLHYHRHFRKGPFDRKNFEALAKDYRYFFDDEMERLDRLIKKFETKIADLQKKKEQLRAGPVTEQPKGPEQLATLPDEDLEDHFKNKVKNCKEKFREKYPKNWQEKWDGFKKELAKFKGLRARYKLKEETRMCSAGHCFTKNHEYRGIKNPPPGYWVYVEDTWYIFESRASKLFPDGYEHCFADWDK